LDLIKTIYWRTNVYKKLPYSISKNFMKKDEIRSILPVERIERVIYVLRGQKIILDQDLAALYGVETKNLNKAVSRNKGRFPEDFAFQLTNEEWNFLRFQFGTSKIGSGGRRYLPFVFTEHGVAMLSSVLNSKKAITINIVIIKTFVKLRQILSTHKELAHKLAELERKTDKHDKDIGLIFEAIRQLMEPPPEKPKRLIGFKLTLSLIFYNPIRHLTTTTAI
jgi:phage regulator Rha-like protein